MQKGFSISMPLLDSSPYDCVLDNHNKLLKIQIKSIHKRKKTKGKNSVKVNLRTGNDFYTAHEVDFFAIYHKEFDVFFIIKNYQQKTVRINIDGKYKNNFNNFALFY